MAHPPFKIVTCLTYEHTEHIYKPDPVSMTIPDMSYSLKELIQKFTLGNLPVDVVRNVMYSDTDDFDEFIAHEYGDFDLTDYQREINKLRELHTLRKERRLSVQQVHEPSEPLEPEVTD